MMKNRLAQKIKFLLDNVLLNLKVDVDAPEETFYLVTIKRYMVVVGFIFFFHAFCHYFYFGLLKDSLFLLCTCIFFLTVPNIFKKYIINKKLFLTLFIILILIVNYYSALHKMESGIFLFYFPLLSAIPIFFEFKSNKSYFIFLLVFIAVNMVMSYFSDFGFIRTNKSSVHLLRSVLSVNVICVISIMGLNFLTVEDRKQNHHFVVSRNSHKLNQIENLNIEVKRLKELLEKDFYTAENLKDLINSAEINDAVFLEKFELFYPTFFDKVKNLSDSPLILSELKLCALLKLGFTTKQIATYTKSTLKSVEGRKSRIRKKLNMPAELDSKIWFSDLV